MKVMSKGAFDKALREGLIEVSSGPRSHAGYDAIAEIRSYRTPGARGDWCPVVIREYFAPCRVTLSRVSADPADTSMDVYAGGTCPICRVYFEDLLAIITPAQYNRLQRGATSFVLDIQRLINISKIIF